MCVIVEIRIQDLANIRGISYSRASVIMKEIRKKLNKTEKQLITPEDLAQHYGVPVQKIIDKMNEKPNKTVQKCLEKST